MYVCISQGKYILQLPTSFKSGASNSTESVDAFRSGESSAPDFDVRYFIPVVGMHRLDAGWFEKWDVGF